MPELIKIKYQKQFKIPSMNASASYELPIPQASIDEHNFFNDLTVINLSTNDMECTPDHNSERSFFIPAKSQQNWSFKDDNMKFSSLTFEEKSAAALSANKIQVIVLKKRLETTGSKE